ncbi:hypothetical protein [Pseudomonas sichuanensis]|uniref:hypothetical protein n=1 Tax=Pseudomonas sichuanensis TaxID=2213015 RepID=UPI002ACB192A|nr:hypothetical protein [Pseudomonas sichuanensis]
MPRLVTPVSSSIKQGALTLRFFLMHSVIRYTTSVPPAVQHALSTTAPIEDALVLELSHKIKMRLIEHSVGQN